MFGKQRAMGSGDVTTSKTTVLDWGTGAGEFNIIKNKLHLGRDPVDNTQIYLRGRSEGRDCGKQRM